MAAIAILLAMALLCGCNGQKNRANEEQAKECPPCRLSEKCAALFAYGLLSDDENDIPLGGACEGVLSDSVIMYIYAQKRMVNNKRYHKEPPDFHEMRPRKERGGCPSDIDLLNLLLVLRDEIRWGDGEWLKLAGYVSHCYGTDYSFYWQLAARGVTGDVLRHRHDFFNLDTLSRIGDFSDYAGYLDTSLTSGYSFAGEPADLTPRWCEDIAALVTGLREYSKDDFIPRYYDIRCLNKDSSSIKRDG